MNILEKVQTICIITTNLQLQILCTSCMSAYLCWCLYSYNSDIITVYIFYGNPSKSFNVIQNGLLVFHLATVREQIERKFPNCSGVSLVNASRSMSFRPDGLADLKHLIFTKASALRGTYGGVTRDHSIPVIGRKVCKKNILLRFCRASYNTLIYRSLKLSVSFRRVR